MLYLERNINVNKGQATIDETVILYKGDKNVEIQFSIRNIPFRCKSTNLEPIYGELIIQREKANPIFSKPARLVGGKLLFVITADMIDELNEIGKYNFQIRLFNGEIEVGNSRATLPAVVGGIEIKEPICEEEAGAIADTAVVDEAQITESEQEEAFDEEGKYNATQWSSGMVISSGKLNKIENAIGTINSNYVSNNTLVEKDYASVDYVNTKLGDIESILRSINGEEI